VGKRGTRTRLGLWLRGRHRLVAVASVLAATTSMLGPVSAQALAAALPQAHGKVWSPPDTALPHTKGVPGHAMAKPKAVGPPKPVPGPWAAPTAVSVVAGSTTVDVPGVSAMAANGRTAASQALNAPVAVRAGDLPVWLASTGVPTADSRRGQAAVPAGAGTGLAVRATVEPATQARAAGIHGILLALAPGSAAASGRGVQLGLDLSALNAAYGGNAALNARLVQLPACALTSPQDEGCMKATVIPSHYDAATRRLVADVTLPTTGAVSHAAAAVRGALVAPQGMVVAAQATASGSAGSYAASSLQPSAAWTSGNSSGSFIYSYPITMPPALGGSAPQVSLSYDSSSVDGRTSSTNAQASEIGDGWGLSAGGAINQSFQSCSNDGITNSADECWGGYQATMTLDGQSSTLVHDDSDKAGVWHLQDDDGTTVQFVTSGESGGNGGTYNEYAKVSDSSGMTYYFGLNHLPGGDGTDPSTNSSWTVPVYSPNTGDPCHDTTDGAGSWCNMPWQMNLSYAVDPHGNLITYTYSPDPQNYYERGAGQNQGTGTLSGYTPGGALKEIDYGQTLAGQIAAKGKGTVAASVVFNLANRCYTASALCPGTAISSSTAADFPDVPYYLDCGSIGTCTTYSPTFWSDQRLDSITTQVTSGGKPKEVDLYQLTQSFPATNDGTSPALWLNSIQHTGEDGTAIPLPKVIFTPQMMPNRVDGSNLVPAPPQFNRARIQSITTETGETVNVNYNLPACSRVNGPMPASADSNTLACYPVLWYPPGSAANAPPADDWFNHYTVQSVTENDEVGDSAQRVTSYTYGPAAWHRDDSPMTASATRTWDDFRGFASVTAVAGSGADGPQTKKVTYYAQGMDGDYNAQGTAVPATVGTGTLGGVITDSDWLAGQVIETDTYNHADTTGDPGTVASYSYTRETAPVTTATETQGDNMPPLIARYDATVTTSVSEGLKANGKWRSSTTVVTTDPAHGNRTISSDTVADGLPETCTLTQYATSTDPQLTDLVDQILTLTGTGACTLTPSSTNTVSGSQTLYDDQAFGKAGAIGDPTSATALDHYDTSGNAVYVPTTSTAYDSYGRVVSTTDPNATDSTHTTGATTTITYTPAAAGELPDKIVTVKAAPSSAPNSANGWSSTATYDIARNLALTTTDVNLKTTTVTYDALGRITAEWKAGHATSGPADVLFSYAVNGTKAPSTTTTETLGPLGSKRLYDIALLNGFGQAFQDQTTPGDSAYTGRMITDTYYDSHGWTVKTHSAWYDSTSAPSTTPYSTSDTQVPAETLTAYNGLGQPVTETDDSLGQVQDTTTIGYPGVDETDTTPPAGGTPTTTITDTAGRTSQLWQYHGATATRVAADADVTNYGYNAAGQQISRRDAAGNTWTYLYDLRGREISASDPDTGASSTNYNADGQVATTTDANKQTLAYTYDLLGRKTGEYDTTVAPDKELAAWTYDTVTGGLGQPATSTRYTSTRYTSGSTGPAYTETTLGYDNAYQSTGTTTTMPGSVIGQTAPLSYTSRVAYDPSTELPTASEDGAAAGQAAEVLNYTYDVNGALLTYGSNASTYDVSTDYDAYGEAVRSTVNPYSTQVVSTYDYDPASGRLLSNYIDKQTSTNGAVDQDTYTYNPAGQLTSASDIPDNTPADTDLQCYSYDYLGRLTTAWTDTGKTTTAPAPSIPGIGSCNDSSPTSNATAGSTTVGGPAAYWTSYGYDLTGNRTSEVQHNTAGNTADDITTNQVFPPAGTANTPTTAANTGGGTGGPHALLSTSSTGPGNPGSSAYQYDADGNTTAITSTAGTTTMKWNAEGELASETPAGSTGATTYIYDASGNLLVQTDSTTTTVYLGDDQITYNATSGAPPQDTRYYPVPNGLTIVRMGAAETIEAANPQGTSGLALNASNLAETRRYLDPFGNPRGTIPGTWIDANGYGDQGFVGGTQDPTTGLTNLGAREYQPTTGRFLNTDPIINPGDPQQWNAYAYSDNDPVNLSDPTGMDCTGNGAEPDQCGSGGPTGTSDPCGNGVYADGCNPNNPGTSGDTNGPTANPCDATCQNQATATGDAEAAADAAAAAQQARQNRIRNLELQIKQEEKTLLASMSACAPEPMGRFGDCINALNSAGSGTLELEILGVTGGIAVCWIPGVDGVCAAAAEISLTGEISVTTAAGLSSAAGGLVGGEATAFAAAEAGDSTLTKLEKELDSLTGCTTNSFPYATSILLASGKTEPIGNAKVGDTVLATNPLTGETRPEKIVAVIKTLTDTDFTTLTIHTSTGNRTITSTQAHPYWDTTTQRWTNAADLHPGDHLREPTGATVTVAKVHDYTGHITTYNLTVNDLHTYYVIAGATPVLVHNDDGTMVGANGTQITSSTVWRGPSGMRIDVENPNPGGRPGQMHLQIQVNGMKSSDAPKYQYNFETGQFDGLPKNLQKELAKTDFSKGVKKGLSFLGEAC